VEGQIIMDRGLSSNATEDGETMYRRRAMKIKDETGSINITVWNKKVN
jgi:hypothetical protein